MSPRFVLGRENVPCVAEVVNRSLKADCTDFTIFCLCHNTGRLILKLLDDCFLSVAAVSPDDVTVSKS